MNPIEHLEAEQFYAFTESGLSRPARVRCAREDRSKVDVYVKFRGSVQEREFSLFAELLCSQLGRELGFNVPTPFVVNLSPEFLAGVPKVAHDIVARSLGLNFATESAPAGFSFVPPEPRIPTVLRPSAAEIFAFDVVMQNCDRKADNPNLLWDRTRIMLIDHERALGFVRETSGPSFNALELDRFYDHVFYSVISPNDAQFNRLTESLADLSAARLDYIFAQVPEEWYSEADLAKTRRHLKWVIENRIQVCNLIRERLS